MIKIDEEALICDLAEVYHIYDYKQLPAWKVAVFAVGLRDNSRIKMAMNHELVPFETLLSAGILDRLSLLLWAKTKDAASGRNRPESIVDKLKRVQEESQELVFASGEEFDKARAALLKELGGED